MNIFKKFVINFFHVNVVLQENHETLQRAFSYVNTLNEQLDSCASGVLPQSVISPDQLQSLLLTIKRQLPGNLLLPADPYTDIWLY